MKALIKFVISRARERSTWLGLTSIATALGLVVTPETNDAVIATGMSVAGLIGALTKDKK